MSMIIYLLEDHPTRKPAELTPLIDIFLSSILLGTNLTLNFIGLQSSS